MMGLVVENTGILDQYPHVGEEELAVQMLQPLTIQTNSCTPTMKYLSSRAR